MMSDVIWLLPAGFVTGLALVLAGALTETLHIFWGGIIAWGAVVALVVYLGVEA